MSHVVKVKARARVVGVDRAAVCQNSRLAAAQNDPNIENCHFVNVVFRAITNGQYISNLIKQNLRKF